MTPNSVLVSVCLPGQLERSQDVRVDFLPSLEDTEVQYQLCAEEDIGVHYPLCTEGVRD